MTFLCAPALIHLVLSFVGIIVRMFYQFQVVAIIIESIFVLLWAAFLNFLCSTGYKKLSWFLVVLPFILQASILAWEISRKGVLRPGSVSGSGVVHA